MKVPDVSLPTQTGGLGVTFVLGYTDDNVSSGRLPLRG